MNVRLLTSIALFALTLTTASAEAWDIEWIDQFGNSVVTSSTGGKTDSTGVYVGGSVFGALPGQAGAGGNDIWASDTGVYVGANLTTSFPGDLPDGARSDRSECPGLTKGNAFADKLDAYVRRYDFNGDVIWTHQFGSNVFDLVTGLGTDATSVYATGDTSCQVDEGEAFSGRNRDAFIVGFAVEPTSVSGLIQLIVGRLETLSDRDRLGPGEFSSSSVWKQCSRPSSGVIRPWPGRDWRCSSATSRAYGDVGHSPAPRPSRS